jgi:spore coat polysaccharide biosynthesis protein SpsF
MGLTQPSVPTLPDRLDVEIFTKETLMRLNGLNLSFQERERVTLGIRNKPEQFSLRNFVSKTDQSNLRWAVDYEEDFVFISQVYSHFEKRKSDFEYEEVLHLLEKALLKPSTISASRRNKALLKPIVGHN